MKLRLLLWDECNRKCKGCCNKGFDLPALPECASFDGFDLIMLTGGEPMLYPVRLLDVISRIQVTDTPILVYTAKVDDTAAAISVLSEVQGVTVTIHSKRDIDAVETFDQAIMKHGLGDRSLRLNIFHGIRKPTLTAPWVVKSNIQWIKDCPLPEGEVLMRVKPELLEGKVCCVCGTLDNVHRDGNYGYRCDSEACLVF
jgi:organic radical activating enzyme